MQTILDFNPQLRPFEKEITERILHWVRTRDSLLPRGGTLSQFANGHHFFGIHRQARGWIYREWAPAAEQLWLTGDFNDWNRTSHPLTAGENGVWELVLPEDDALWNGCKVKTLVQYGGEVTEHIPLYARRVVQDTETILWSAEVWAEEEPFSWTNWPEAWRATDSPLPSGLLGPVALNAF